MQKVDQSAALCRFYHTGHLDEKVGINLIIGLMCGAYSNMATAGQSVGHKCHKGTKMNNRSRGHELILIQL